MQRGSCSLTLFAALWIAAAAVFLFSGRALTTNAATPAAQPAVPAAQSRPVPADPTRVVAPYEEYTLTQGLHGAEYGHAAIDLSAGKGAPIRSPIEGDIKAHFVDAIGNTNLLIENDVYMVTLLHGLYKVQEGDHVTLGQIIGLESNQGYTVDAWGRLCTGRDCGYHTHLNILDKRSGENINPLELFAE